MQTHGGTSTRRGKLSKTVSLRKKNFTEKTAAGREKRVGGEEGKRRLKSDETPRKGEGRWKFIPVKRGGGQKSSGKKAETQQLKRSYSQKRDRVERLVQQRQLALASSASASHGGNKVAATFHTRGQDEENKESDSVTKSMHSSWPPPNGGASDAGGSISRLLLLFDFLYKL